MEHRRRVRAEGRGKKTTHTHTPTRRCPSQVLALGSGSVCWHFSHPSINQSVSVSQSVGSAHDFFFSAGGGPKRGCFSLPPPCFFQRSRNRFPGYPVLRAREIGRSGWRFVQREIGARITASIQCEMFHTMLICSGCARITRDSPHLLCLRRWPVPFMRRPMVWQGPRSRSNRQHGTLTPYPWREASRNGETISSVHSVEEFR